MKLFIITQFFLLNVVLAQSETNKLEVGQAAPAFSLPDLQNEYVFLRDYSGEKLRKSWKNKTKHVVVLSFFATWCAPCKKEIPYLEQLQTEFKDKDIKFFLIDVGEERAKIEEFLKTTKVGLKILHDRYQQTAEKYNATSLPRLIVIDKNGIVKLIKKGFKDGESFLQEMRALINTLTI